MHTSLPRLSPCLRKGLSLATILAALLSISATASAQTKVTFGSSTTYVVPPGITSLVVKAWGGGGASGDQESSSPRSNGGGGGYVFGQLVVTPGETLNVVVGGGGVINTPGASAIGVGGIGDAMATNAPPAGAGGGASGIMRGATVLVAAGAGGGGGAVQDASPKAGGAGGGATGLNGADVTLGGFGATQSAPGGGGNPASGNPGLPGVGSTGGAGSIGNGQNAGGGGGGGGYFGGGGGARSGSGASSGGGGGGSSYIGGMTNATTTAGSGTTPGNSADTDRLAGRGVGGTTATGGGAGYVVLIVPPGISNQSATNIGFFQADLNADINANGDATDTYFQWGTSPTLAGATNTATTNVGDGTIAVTNTETISPLLAHTTYYYRAVAVASGLTVYGPIQSFTTLNNNPTVTRVNASVTVNEGSAAANNGTFGDADGDSVTISASVGTITQGVGTWSWSYTPPDGPLSPTVTITANDGFSGITTTTFTLNVNNVAPTIALTGNPTVNEGSSYTLNLGLISDPGTDTVSGYSIDWGDGTTVTTIPGLPPATANHTYVDGPDGGILRTIIVKLADEDNAIPQTAGTLGVTVNNVAPTANPQTYTVAEDSGLGTITLVATDPGVLDVISYGLVTGLANPAAGTLGIVSGNTISFTPAADFNGSTTFTFNASADMDTSNTATVTIVVTPVNDAPTGVNDSVASSLEEAARSFSIATLVSNDSKGPADESGQTLTITAIGTVSGGSAVINGANIDFTPDADFNGPAFITYTVRDNGQTNGVDDFKTSTAQILFTIAPVNDAPVAVDDPLSAINEDSGTRLIPMATLLGNDSTGPGDENTQTLSITAVSNPIGGTVVINGANVEFSPTLNFNGPASFDYTVSDDGQSGSPLVNDFKTATGNVTFTITPVNDAPIITPGSAITRIAGASASNSPIATVSDIETTPGSLVVTASTVPAGINVTNIVNSTGAITADVSANAGTAAGPYIVVLNVFDGTTNITANLTVNVLVVDYTVVNTAGALVVTDITGNSDTLDITEPVAGSIKFAAATRVFLVNNTTGIVGDSGNITIAGLTSVTVNTATGTDIINVAAIATAMPSLTINGGIGDDTVNMNGDITFAANASLDLDLQNDDPSPGLDIITVAASANLLTSGTGTITGKATRNVSLAAGSSFETTNGGIVLHGNTAGTAAGNFQGVVLSGGSLRSTGTGDITVEGQGGDDAATSTHAGVYLISGATVNSTGTGRITLTGGGGTGTSNNSGVRLTGSTVQVTSSTGAIELIGTGGTGSSSFNIGVVVLSGAKILATGSAPVTLRGTGGSGSSVSRGIDLEGAGTVVTTVNGNLLLTGTGGTDTTNQSMGIAVLIGSGVASTGTGTVTLDGVAGNSPTFSPAVLVDGLSTPTLVTSATGNILLRGRPGPTTTGTFHLGVLVQGQGKVTSTGTGAQAATITLDGVGSPGTSTNIGVWVSGIAGALSSVDGAISIKGAAGGGGVASDSYGIAVQTTGAISSTGTASVDIRADSQYIDTGSTIINAGTNSVTLRPLTSAYPTDLGAADTDTTLGLSDAELDAITAGTLNIGDSASGNITFSAAISPANAPLVNLITGGSIKNTNAGTTLTVANSTSSGTMAPGASPGIFSIAGNHSLVAGSTFAVEIGGNTVGTGYDQLSATGTVNIGANVTLNVSSYLAFVPGAGQDYVIVNRTGGTGTFTGLAEGATFPNFLGSGLTAKLTYVGGNGDDIVISTAAPDIQVEHPLATILFDGNAVVNFGTVNVGGSSAAKTFTITNTGSAPLNIGAFTFTGTDFSVNTAGLTTPLGIGLTTTFTATFTPIAAGSRSAVLHIANDVAGAKNPFDITFTGTGTSVIPTELHAQGTTPGSDIGIFDSLRSGAVLSSNGALALRATLRIGTGTPPVTATDFAGVWRSSDGTIPNLLLAARSSSPAPDVASALYGLLPYNAALSPDGKLSIYGFMKIGTGGVTSTTDTAIWSEAGTGGPLKLVVREGDVTAGGTLLKLPRSAWVSTSSAGHNAFAVTYTTNLTALLRTTSTPGSVSIETIAQQGSATPAIGAGTGGNFSDLNTVSADPRLNAQGDAAFLGLTDSVTSNIGLWYKPVGGALSALARAGQATPGVADTFIWFEQPSLRNNFVAFRAFTSTKNGIWAGNPATPLALTCLAKTGDTLPGMTAGTTLNSVWSPFSNASGKVAFRVTTVGDGSEKRAIATNASGTLKVVAKIGGLAPGLGAETFANFDHPVIGDGDHVAFLASTNAGTVGLWRIAGQSFELLLKVGDSVTTQVDTRVIADIGLVGSSSGDRRNEMTSVDASGRVLVFLSFVDGSTAQQLTAP